jgi:hypothetical protein
MADFAPDSQVFQSAKHGSQVLSKKHQMSGFGPGPGENCKSQGKVKIYTQLSVYRFSNFLPSNCQKFLAFLSEISDIYLQIAIFLFCFQIFQ